MEKIAVKKLTAQIEQKTILQDISFEVEAGQSLVIIGESGSGKTLLTKILIGQLPSSLSMHGEIHYGTMSLERNSLKDWQQLRGSRVAYMSQNPMAMFNPFQTIQSHFWETLRSHSKISKDACIDKAVASMKEVRLGEPEELLKKYPFELSGGMLQRVMLAILLCLEPETIILDEPTSSLTENEVKHLFKIIRKLQGNGIGIVYISHKMEEITEICDEITILRDGKWVTTEKVKDLTTDQIINLMVGRDLTNRFPDKTNKPGEVILEVEHLTAKRPKSIEDVSFTLRKGEILGIAGLVGSKRTDIVETLFGVIEKKSGTIKIDGKEVNIRNPKEATKNGLALITEERRATGIYSMLDIKFNSIISNTRNYKALLGLLDNSKIEKDTKWVIDSMHVKTPSQKTHIGSLSGGNQQKVIIGRWLLTAPEILLMDEPTRGIDVGAKFEIYQLMINLAEKEKGIIMISSEMPELLGVTDRILVMSNGRVAGIVNTAETSQEEILKLTAKYL